jgi:ketosteroid isomerase-like protein
MADFLARLKQRKPARWGVAWMAFVFALLQGIDFVRRATIGCSFREPRASWARSRWRHMLLCAAARQGGDRGGITMESRRGHMQRFGVVVAMVCVGLCAGGARAAGVPPSVQQQIGVVMAAMGHAAKVHDTDRFMAAYMRGPDLVFAINGTVIHGWDALRAQQLIWWRNGKSNVVYTQQGKTEFMGLASGVVATTETIASRRTMPDGRVSTGTFVVTAIWKKLPQGWRIVYGHESWTKPPG